MIRWQIAAVLGPLAILACVAAPVSLAVREQRQIKNFHVVREGVLYRSAQLTPAGLRRVIHDQRIRTVVNLREGSAAVDLAEEKYCRREEIRFIRLPPKSWDDSVGQAEVDDNVRVFLDVMRDPANYPVLVHCFAGIHRTGAYCAVYRMEFEGWDNATAIAEVKAMGYDNFDNELDIKGWLEGYRPGRLLTPRTTASADASAASRIRPGMTFDEVQRLVGPGLKPLLTGGLVGGVAFAVPSRYPDHGIVVHWASGPKSFVVESVKSLEPEGYDNNPEMKWWMEWHKGGQFWKPTPVERLTHRQVSWLSANERGRWLANHIKVGTPWPACQEMIGETNSPAQMFSTGGVLCVIYCDLHLSVLVSLPDEKVISVKYHEEW